jgi:hypothetical protein
LASFVYVDNSNVWIEGMHVSAVQRGLAPDIWTAQDEKIADGDWRLDFGRLYEIAGGETVGRAVLYGSKPPPNDSLWRAAELQGFEVVVFERNMSNREKKVDTQLAAHVIADSPDAFTSAARLMHFPDNPNVSERFRGQSFVIVFVCHLGAAAEADRIIAPLRTLRPVTDTLNTIPVETLSRLHMDPDQPTPAVGDALLLERLSPEAMEAFIRTAGSRTNTRLIWAELMHLGGEMKRAQPDGGSLAAIDAEYQLAAGGGAPNPEAAEGMEGSLADLFAAMKQWASRHMYLNVAATRRDPASFWTPKDYERLRRIKAAVDPGDLIRSNHPIASA